LHGPLGSGHVRRCFSTQKLGNHEPLGSGPLRRCFSSQNLGNDEPLGCGKLPSTDIVSAPTKQSPMSLGAAGNSLSNIDRAMSDLAPVSRSTIVATISAVSSHRLGLSRALLSACVCAALVACKRAPTVDPQQQQLNARMSELAQVPLPEARSARTSAAPPHLRLVLTSSAVELDNLLVARARAGVTPIVRSRAVQLDSGAFRASDIRGGEHGFLVEPLRDAFAELRRPFEPDASAQPTLHLGIYAASNASAYTLYRALYTIAQTGNIHVHLMLRRNGEHVALALDVPDAREAGAARDCWHYTVHAGTEQSKIAARFLRRGETVESVARRAATVALEALTNGGDAAVLSEPATSSERPLEMRAGAIDLDAFATELRSMQTALGGQACEPVAVAVDRALTYGALLALQERVQSDLALSPVRLGLRN
jgi:hypothetical protein